MGRVILVFLVLSLFYGCKKEDNPTSPTDNGKDIPTISTDAVSNITGSSAVSGGNITNDGGSAITERGVCWGTSENPGLSGNKTTSGSGKGSFTSTLTGLNAGTIYYVRAFATNSSGTAYGNQIIFTSSGLVYNGVTYHTTIIGNQEWTVENLRTGTYGNGSSIDKVTDNSVWVLTSNRGAYCAFANDQSNVTIHGYLYNWYATASIAPLSGGWRVPSDEDWRILIEFLGGETLGGSKLKAKSGWAAEGNGSDIYGFSALPSGNRYSVDGNFYYFGLAGSWWSSTGSGSDGKAWYVAIAYNNTAIGRFYGPTTNGLSIRLVRDVTK